MELTELITPLAILIVGVIAWLVNRGRIEGNPVEDAVGIVYGIETLWEQGRIQRGDKLDAAIHALTKRHRYLDYDAAVAFIEGAVRIMKQEEQDRRTAQKSQ